MTRSYSSDTAAAEFSHRTLTNITNIILQLVVVSVEMHKRPTELAGVGGGDSQFTRIAET